MGRYFVRSKNDLTSVTAQDVKTLTEILDEFSRTGQLDSLGGESGSFDFNSAEEVDFDKPVPQDVDIYDAASGLDDPYLNVKPFDKDTQTSDTTQSATEGATAQD